MAASLNELVRAVAPMAPLAAMLVAALAALSLHAFYRRCGAVLEGGVVVAGLALTALLAWHIWPQASSEQRLGLAPDRLAMIGTAIVCSMAALVALASPSYLEAKGELRRGYFGLLAMSALGMTALTMSADLITMLLSIETMSLCLYALAGFMRDKPQSVEGALKYFVMGAFATAFFCMGIAFIFGSLGTTDLAVLANRSAYVTDGEGRSVFLFGLAMVVSGLAFKIAAVPFHAWAPDAYDGAPTPVAMLLATSAKAAAMIAFLRLALAVAGPGGAMWHHLSFGLAAATIVWGNLAAMKQQNMKRMLAYSTVAHMGYMLIAFPLLAQAPVAMARAVVMYLIAYCISAAGAFAALSAIGLAPGEPVDVRHLSGLSRKRPLLSFALSLFLLSLAGFPPTLGFFGKYYLFLTALSAGEIPLVVVALVGTVISFFYYLRPVMAIYFRKEADREMGTPTTVDHALYTAMVAALAVAALAVIVFGVLPENLIALVRASAV